MLEIKDLSVRYGKQAPTIEHFNLNMKKGEIISVVGESGSGKTTVIRAVLGALAGGGKVTQGDILFNGKSLLTNTKDEWRQLRGTRISMIFQDCGGTLNPIRKIGSQFVEYICTHSKVSKDEAWKKGVSMLEKMRLPEAENIMNSYPHQLSGGMRQRVGIAMAMTFNPELLLADEPTSALDVTTQAQIVRQMMELRDDFHTGIIIVTHNIGVAAYMADQLIVMQNGKVVDQGTRDEVMNHRPVIIQRSFWQQYRKWRDAVLFKESDIVLSAKHIVKQFPASHGRTLTACNDINLNVYKGKTLGIVGESGCGKSTFVRMVISLDKPTSGEILYHGKNLADLSKKETWLNRQNMQMVFQDPLASFDPKMKIVDILTEPLINFGKLKKSEKEAKARELLEMVELPGDFVDRYPHNMSGGQRQRISIARALSLEPEILVCDEATSALDVSVQESVIELLVRLQKEKNISMLFICHDLALIRSFAHQIAVMYLGNIVEVIPGEDVTEHAVHPYTQALLGAQFSIHMDPSQKIQSIESEAPSPLDVPKGCPFQNRCEHCTDRCKAEMPKLKEIAPGHEAACFYVEEHLKN